MPERDIRPFHREYQDHLFFSQPAIRRDFDDPQSTLHRQVMKSMTWLASMTPGASQALSPEQRVRLAFEAAQGGVRKTADKHGLHHQVIKRALRDTIASLWLFHHPDREVKGWDEDLVKRVESLRAAKAELVTANMVWNEPIREALRQQVPPVADLVNAYLENRTAQPLLETYQVPVNAYQLRSVRRFVMEPDTDEALDGMSSLARRYLFARWLQENWSYSQIPADDLIAAAAVFIFTEDISQLPDREPDRLRSMRAFLTEMIYQECRSILDSRRNKNTRRQSFLVDDQGETTITPDRVDVIGSYANLAQQGQGIIALKNYAQKVIQGISQQERIKGLLTGQTYSDSRRKDLDWAGLKFLENVLMWTTEDRRLSLSVFTADMTDNLKQGR